MDQKLPFNTLSASPVHLLHRASQCAADDFASAMGDSDLTPRQYAVLLTVAAHEGLSQTALVSRTGIDRSTLADVVRRMLRKGLLSRQRTKHDARAYAIRLTDAGAEALAAAAPHAAQADEAILGNLTQKQRDQLIDLLTLVVEGHEAVVEPEPRRIGGGAARPGLRFAT